MAGQANRDRQPEERGRGGLQGLMGVPENAIQGGNEQKKSVLKLKCDFGWQED